MYNDLLANLSLKTVLEMRDYENPYCLVEKTKKINLLAKVKRHTENILCVGGVRK